MARSAMIRARTEPGLKTEVERIFHKLGLSCSEAINLFFAQVTLKKGIPFDVLLPGRTTLKAMKEVEERKSVKAKDLNDLFNKLGI
ncbi:MAG: type II toxin-antitoxin system RelB/DinJ family antitoxin [Candidatus Omnitrophica bacterium]|nr:type II toxin-antitoxin system RelB/DinJ family antitoxin [Candidatus Omnitrophota bacterium]